MPPSIETAIRASLESIRHTEPASQPDTHRVEHETIRRHPAEFGDGLIHFTDGRRYALQEFSRQIGLYLLNHCSDIVRKNGTTTSQNLAGQPSENARWEFVSAA